MTILPSLIIRKYDLRRKIYGYEPFAFGVGLPDVFLLEDKSSFIGLVLSIVLPKKFFFKGAFLLK